MILLSVGVCFTSVGTLMLWLAHNSFVTQTKEKIREMDSRLKELERCKIEVIL